MKKQSLNYANLQRCPLSDFEWSPIFLKFFSCKKLCNYSIIENIERTVFQSNQEKN